MAVLARKPYCAHRMQATVVFWQVPQLQNEAVHAGDKQNTVGADGSKLNVGAEAPSGCDKVQKSALGETLH